MAICWKISGFRSSLVVTQAFHISYPVEQAACKYQQIFSICGSAADTGVEERTPSFIVSPILQSSCILLTLPESCWPFSWLYGCFSFHWELCSSFLLLQAAHQQQQPKPSQGDRFNGYPHSDQTNLPLSYAIHLLSYTTMTLLSSL